MNNKLTLRTCIACRTVRPQRELLRITVDKESRAVIDKNNKLGGRGAYVCHQKCLRTALNKKLLPRALRSKVDTAFL